MDIPIFIISFNRVTCLRQLLDALGDKDITIVDGGSTYEPLLDFLRTTEHKVIRCARSDHKIVWSENLIPADKPFIITDPDVVPDDQCPNDYIEVCLDVLNWIPSIVKVGPSLSLDIPEHYAFKDTVMKWESRYYDQTNGERNGVTLHPAPIDTTFALYRQNTPYMQMPAIRLGKPYIWRHLPWYTDSANPTEEDSYYAEHADKKLASWLYNRVGDDYR